MTHQFVVKFRKETETVFVSVLLQTYHQKGLTDVRQKHITVNPELEPQFQHISEEINSRIYTVFQRGAPEQLNIGLILVVV